MSVEIGIKVKITAFANDIIAIAEKLQDLNTSKKIFIREAEKVVGLKTNQVGLL